MANPSLPSFVELMASLGLQDEHAANALLHGASGDTVPVPVVSEPPISNYRQSTASLDSSGTPLSTASLLTPLSSPSVQREQRERPTSHGKKRYSPYGLSTVVNGDIYARRGSVPDILSQSNYDRRLHHLSAPEPYHDHSGRITDEDGDEEMQDASSTAQKQEYTPSSPLYKSPTATAVHCIGQPNLLISRQRMSRQGVLPRTKSYSHMRTTSIGASAVRPPLPTSPRMDMPMDTERANNDADGDIAVVSISSLLRRSHSTTQQQQQPRAAAPPMLSLDSPRGYQFPSVPPIPSAPPPQPPTTTSTTTSTNASSTSSTRPVSHRAPPSAPPTKTSFGFLPGVPLSGNIASLSAVRRARHARSSSARSVRDMIREREGGVLLAPLHSFHPMGETEEEGAESKAVGPQHQHQSVEKAKDKSRHLLKPVESRVRHRSTGQIIEKGPERGTTPPTAATTPASLEGSGSERSSFLPLDDSSRSFSHRRRVKRHTTEATTTTRGGKRSSPPPPLMLPTLPLNLMNIRALVDRDATGGNGGGPEKDRLAADAGYVSRREPHSPDPRGSWRRRVAPLELAGM